MMHFGLILILFLPFTSMAFVVQSKIAGIDIAQAKNEPHLILLEENGMVGFLGPESSSLLEQIQFFKSHDHLLEWTLNSSHQIEGVRSLGEKKVKKVVHLAPQDYRFQPTVLGGIAEAEEIFSELNPNAKEKSECYNRAHVWTYEEKSKRDLNSMKVFLFFTRKYIREHNYGWWFHVSPYVLIRDEIVPMERVIDAEFSSQPLSMKSWTDIFIIPKTACAVVQKYSDYELHQDGVNCYLIKVSMYFWQPMDIEQNERDGSLKTGFIPSEVEWAYKQGF